MKFVRETGMLLWIMKEKKKWSEILAKTLNSNHIRQTKHQPQHPSISVEHTAILDQIISCRFMEYTETKKCFWAKKLAHNWDV